MSKKLFWQIVLLIVIAALAAYVIYPKYYFFPDMIGTAKYYFKCNKITGKIVFTEGDVWKVLR